MRASYTAVKLEMRIIIIIIITIIIISTGVIPKSLSPELQKSVILGTRSIVRNFLNYK